MFMRKSTLMSTGIAAQVLSLMGVNFYSSQLAATPLCKERNVEFTAPSHLMKPHWCVNTTGQLKMMLSSLIA